MPPASSGEPGGEPGGPPGPTGRVAWFHCFAGIAGDMALGALLDAGAGEAEVRALLQRLPLPGWSMSVEPVLRGGLAATRVAFTVEEDGRERRLPEVLAILEAAALPQRVHRRAAAAFTALAAVEGRLHRQTPDEVHFHELGGHDTILDLVGTAAALEVLAVDEVRSSPVRTGTGTVSSAHGLIPNPSPAVLALLAGAPLSGVEVGVELTTPTGAAVLSAMGSGFGPLPAMIVEATGYGAGARELDGLPNCTQVVVGLRAGATGTAGTAGAAGAAGALPAAQPLLLLEANLDDVTGEQVADAIVALLGKGALDAWATPVVMKKGRPGLLLSCLADVASAAALRSALLDETGTLGVRIHVVERYAQPRRFELVSVEGEPVRVKVSAARIKAEHDDAATAAGRLGLPVREVARRAEELARRAAPRP